MAFTSFTISQAFLGAPLQFYPVLGSLELEELIDAFVTGSSSKADKMSEVTLDFFNNATVDLNTGALVRHYNVFSTAAAAWSPTQSNSSGFSPVIYTPSPASSTAATSFGDSGYGSISGAAQTPPAVKNTNSVAAGRVSKKGKKMNETRLPGFSIMTKDGVDVTNSAGRGTKTKEQREHAHLMRIMKACDACKKKKIRCDPSHRRAQTDMSRTSTTSSSSASAANTHTSRSSSSGTSSSLPSPPTNDSSIPSFTNALDDFVLFPQEVSSWNPSFSLSDPNIPIPHDFALSDFDFDAFVSSGDGGMDFNEFSPLDPDTSFFHPEAQFQTNSQSHMEMAFSEQDYMQSQQTHAQEDAWNEDGGNWDLPLQSIRSQRPAISPSDGLQSQFRSQTQTQQGRSPLHSPTDAQTCPLHELGDGSSRRQQRGATQSSRTTQVESFPLERFLQSSSPANAPLSSETVGSARMIATNSLHDQNRNLVRQVNQEGSIDDRWTSLSPMDWSALDVSTNANASSSHPIASSTQTSRGNQLREPVLAPSDESQHNQSNNATSRIQDPELQSQSQSQSRSPLEYTTSPLSSGDVIHDLSQRPQLPSPQSSPMDLTSTAISLVLTISIGLAMFSTPSCVHALWGMFAGSGIDAPAHWGYARLALSALLIAQLPSPFLTSTSVATDLKQTLHGFITLVLLLGGKFFSSSSGLWNAEISASDLMTSEFRLSPENGLSSSSRNKGFSLTSTNKRRGNENRNTEMFGVDVGMGSGRGIVTPWILALLREISEDFGDKGLDDMLDESGDVVMMG